MNDEKKPFTGYRFGKITILEFMGVLAVIGVLATWVLHRFFG